jgi:predicted ATPase
VPLFVEEVTRLLLERGVGGGAQAIPPTLQQSLAARLDRLGPAREIAQIGAVLGRDFTFALLQAVSGLDEAGLHSALERLADADLLIAEGAGPQANYRFKHALIQDAAYDSLLKSRRQSLHRRAAEVLRDLEGEAEAIAHHFTQAGLDDAAIEWWGKAGDQALRRSAFQEAISHLGKAIAMADKGSVPGRRDPVEAVAPNLRLKLQTDYSRAVMWSKGFAAAETIEALARASELSTPAPGDAERFKAYHSQWARSATAGDLQSARESAETFLREAEKDRRIVEAGVARRCRGCACLWQGDLAHAQSDLEQALSERTPDLDREARSLFGVDNGLVTAACLALAAWHMGEPQRARKLIGQAIEGAAEAGHVPTILHVGVQRTLLESHRNDEMAVLQSAETLLALGIQQKMEFYVLRGELFLSWANGRLRDPKVGATKLRQALLAWNSRGNRIGLPHSHGLLAGLEAETGGFDNALTLIDEGLAIARQTREHWTDSFLHRIRGDILLKADPENPVRAEEPYLAAIAVAREQGARSFGLRAALSLAKLYQSTGRPVEAHDALAPALQSFSPTPEMPEIAEAQALLAALAERADVKVEAARRQQRQHLHVAYGNALIATRGFGAPETMEAFAKVRETAYGDKDAPERLAADFGLWNGSFTRGDLPSMRALAATILADVQVRPESAEAGVAQRILGATQWFAGEYVEARDPLERALALFEPGRDDDLAFRFGFDAGVAAMLYLAFALWPLGDVERAICLMAGAEARTAGLAHIGTHAFARTRAGMFELMRGDVSRAAQNGVELARLAHEHDLPLWRACGAFLEGLATAESGAPEGRLADMRRGVELLREQNYLMYDGLIKIALAEGEARTGDVDRAIAILDEALATSERIGHRAFDAELHRVRGEMLLKRDPANPAPAEEAMRTAIAISQQQSTRSFGLRAALSLAKLYRSTARPAEAHAVLAPALEGFAPTPEMPEIAEALLLSATLA